MAKIYLKINKSDIVCINPDGSDCWFYNNTKYTCSGENGLIPIRESEGCEKRSFQRIYPTIKEAAKIEERAAGIKII